MTLKTTALATILAIGGVISAHALSITPATLPQWSGTQNDQNAINTAIAPIIGLATELYKAEVDDGEEGSLSGSYSTEFSNSPTDPADATITYDGGSTVSGTAWLLVKDGDHTPAWYLFNLTTLGWNGTDTLELTGFWPDEGAISHVTLYGTPGESVPDAGSALSLLGLALIGLASMRHKRSR